MKSPKVNNALLAYIWDKGVEVYKHILMEARECKMRAFLNGPSPMKLGARLMRWKGVNL